MTAFLSMTRYTVRAAVPRKRWPLVLLPYAVSALFGFVAASFSGDPATEFSQVAATALFGLVLPVTCLVLGDAVLGAEIRRGTFTFTWMSPVPPWQIVVARWLGGSLVVAACVAPAFALAAVVADAQRCAGPIALAGAVGGAAYVAVFMAIGSLVSRAAAWSLAYVFIVERLLGTALSGIAQLSPSWEARAAYVGLVGDLPDHLVREGIPGGTGALVRLLLITAVGLAVAARRLPRMRFAGSSD